MYPPALESDDLRGSASNSASEASSKPDRRMRQFSVHLTAKFLVVTFVLSASFAFSVGVMSRIVLLSSFGLHQLMYPRGIPAAASSTRNANPNNANDQGISLERKIYLPIPRRLFNGELKDVPLTTFTTKMFPQKAATTSQTVHLDRRDLSNNSEAKDNFADAQFKEDEDEEDEEDDEENDDDKDEIHLPAGQHLLVDIKHVDSQFLNSQELLAQALVDLIEVVGSTLLSYHCHSMFPMGVSCIGVLLSSHVSIHTWPKEGVIVIDLFTCGVAPLIPILPTIEKLFSIPSQSNGISSEPRMLWSHKLRGFREGFSPYYHPEENPLEQDLELDLLRLHSLDLKVPLVSEESDFQHIDIYQVINPQVNSLAHYEKSLSSDGSYESLHPDLYRPDKHLFLDGVHQSNLNGDAAYHEALVHPAMLAHPNPKRVAIIGGGEGATLREVLKHKTVDEVLMVEIDGELVEICQEHLPDFSNCEDMLGSDADSCFVDSRADVVFEDAFKYFIDNFGVGAGNNMEKFDAIIMDALDPDKFVAIVGSLYKSNEFVNSLFNGLTEEGVFVVQTGEGSQLSDPADEIGPYKDTAHMMETLKNAGFQSMHDYDEGHSHFMAPWSYMACFKSSKSRESWYKNSAELEIDLHQRIYGTKSGKHPLLYFDATTMIGYQLPAKSDEALYCRKAITPQECEEEYFGIDPKLIDPLSQMEAHKNATAKYAVDTVYSPVVERHLRQILGTSAMRDKNRS